MCLNVWYRIWPLIAINKVYMSLVLLIVFINTNIILCKHFTVTGILQFIPLKQSKYTHNTEQNVPTPVTSLTIRKLKQ